MNAWQLAEDFRTGIEGQTAGVLYRHQQDEEKLEEPAYPAVIVNAECKPFSADGKVGAFRVGFLVKSQALSTTGAAHAAIVKDTFDFLLGSKAALISYVAAQAHFTVIGYDFTDDDELGLEKGAFSTPIVIVGTARQLV